MEHLWKLLVLSAFLAQAQIGFLFRPFHQSNKNNHLLIEVFAFVYILLSYSSSMALVLQGQFIERPWLMPPGKHNPHDGDQLMRTVSVGQGWNVLRGQPTFTFTNFMNKMFSQAFKAISNIYMPNYTVKNTLLDWKVKKQQLVNLKSILPQTDPSL